MADAPRHHPRRGVLAFVAVGLAIQVLVATWALYSRVGLRRLCRITPASTQASDAVRT